MSRETETHATVHPESGRTQAREIVEVQRGLIAELEQRASPSRDCGVS
jgi:hypothetical protein